MDPNALPARLAVRLTPSDREALAAVQAAIGLPHRPAPRPSDAAKAAFSIAAEAVKARRAAGTVMQPDEAP